MTGGSEPDRVAIVTGGTSGIGFGIATALAQAGQRVAVISRDEDRCASARTALEPVAGAGRALGIAGDTSDEAGITAAIDEVARRWGRVDSLVTAAGQLARGTVTELQPALFAQAFTVNVLGTWLAIRAAVPHLRRSDSARIVTIGSVLGEVGAAGRSGYSATKGAVHALTKSLALELAADGIGVNCVAPGPTRTEMNATADDVEVQQALAANVPLGRWGSPAEVAHMVLALLDPRARFVTGSVVAVDGGYLAH